jgi:hypothetical protein
MAIIINIKPEVQEELSRQAAAHGLDVNSYAASLLEEAAHVPAGSKGIARGGRLIRIIRIDAVSSAGQGISAHAPQPDSTEIVWDWVNLIDSLLCAHAMPDKERVQEHS